MRQYSQDSGMELDWLVRGFLKGVLKEMMRILDAGESFLLVLDPRSQELVPELSYREPARPRTACAMTEEEVPSISVPLHVKGAAFGVLNFCGKAGRPGFLDADLRFASAMGGYACLIIEKLFDFSRLRRENAALREENGLMEKYAAIGRLASGLVPKINGPLAAAALRAEELSALGQSQGPAGYLEEIRKGLKRVEKITASLLKAFDILREKGRGYVRLDRLLDESIDVLKIGLDRAVRVSREYAPGLPAILDLGLEQAFINIIKNALEAMPQGGELRIKAGMEKTGVRISFADTGCGIPLRLRERIFEPFFSTKAFKGSGLGLSISREIIRTCGGEIECDSQPGKGSRFTVFIPLNKLVSQ